MVADIPLDAAGTERHGGKTVLLQVLADLLTLESRKLLQHPPDFFFCFRCQHTGGAFVRAFLGNERLKTVPTVFRSPLLQCIRTKLHLNAVRAGQRLSRDAPVVGHLRNLQIGVLDYRRNETKAPLRYSNLFRCGGVG